MNTALAPALALNRSAPTLTVRPLQSGDAEALRAFVCGLGAASKRMRFHGAINGCSDSLLARLMAADGQRQVAFVATRALDDGEVVVGDARYYVGRDGRAEFAIMVADAQQGCGVARQLMAALIEHARGAGLQAIDGEVMDGNARMQAFVTRLGFAIDWHAEADAGVQRWTLPLQPQTAKAPALAEALVIAARAPRWQGLRGWWRSAFVRA